jgi:uncharacterized iron-regulated membrane protein
MRFNLLNRKIHYWLSAVVAMPLLIIVATGLLLQVKKQVDWVQPPEQRTAHREPGVGFDRLLASLRAVEGVSCTGWQDVTRLDVRPGKGLIKASLGDGHEVQLDLGSGEVLQVAVRRSDWIESLHDGSWFGGDVGKLFVFLPAGLGLLVLWVSGIWLFLLPFWVRRRRRRAVHPAA